MFLLSISKVVKRSSKVDISQIRVLMHCNDLLTASDGRGQGNPSELKDFGKGVLIR